MNDRAFRISRFEEEIEELVRLRDAEGAQRRIRAYLRFAGKQDLALFQACDWYRRLGLFREGYRLLDIGAEISGVRRRGRVFHARVLWAARFLNLLGASHFALLLLHQSEIRTAEGHLLAGDILISNFKFTEALPHFEEYLRRDPDLSSYPGRIARLSLADCLARLGRGDWSMRLTDEVLDASVEPLLRGIALQARAEYRFVLGQRRKALEDLQAAFDLFPPSDLSPDRGVLLKWLAYMGGLHGDMDSARDKFREALSILHRPWIRAEAWLDVYRKMDELGLLGARDQVRLRTFPGISRETPQAKAEKIISLTVGAEDADLWIDLHREEYVHQGRRYLGIPKEVRLLAWVVLCRGWGIEMERVKSLLWPTEVHAYEQLEGRVHLLLNRVYRKYGVRIKIQDGALDIPGDSDPPLVRVTSGDGTGRPSFLEIHGEFSGGDLSDHYRLSKTQRSLVLRHWLERDWIKAEGRSPRLRYFSS